MSLALKGLLAIGPQMAIMRISTIFKRLCNEVCDAPPHSLKYSNVSSKMKTTEGIGVCSLACNILRVKGRVGASG
jgi:hypothetical protein